MSLILTGTVQGSQNQNILYQRTILPSFLPDPPCGQTSPDTPSILSFCHTRAHTHTYSQKRKQSGMYEWRDALSTCERVFFVVTPTGMLWTGWSVETGSVVVLPSLYGCCTAELTEHRVLSSPWLHRWSRWSWTVNSGPPSFRIFFFFVAL